MDGISVHNAYSSFLQTPRRPAFVARQCRGKPNLASYKVFYHFPNLGLELYVVFTFGPAMYVCILLACEIVSEPVLSTFVTACTSNSIVHSCYFSAISRTPR